MLAAGTPDRGSGWVARRRGLLLVTANGDANLDTDGGRMCARIKAAVARAEIDRKEAWQLRAYVQRARQGRAPKGVRPMGYNLYIAHMRAGKRLKRAKVRKCADPRLWGVIWDKLQLRWSPEQICAYLRMRFPHNQSINPCVETI